MIRRSKERHIEYKENLFEGDGHVQVCSLLNGPEEMYGKGRTFAHSTLQPGCSIGYHVHERESETYYILRGVGEFNDDGTIVQVHPGDVFFTGAGQGHGIRNIGSEPLELIALILYQ